METNKNDILEIFSFLFIFLVIDVCRQFFTIGKIFCSVSSDLLL